MRCTVKSLAGYYAKVNGKPAWVQARADAKVFRTVHLARSVVTILRYNRIRAVVERTEE
jgi:hypothetical protein